MLVLIPYLASCTALESNTRIERGPLLRTLLTSGGTG